MAQSWEPVTFQPGKVIAREGETNRASFIIHEGTVHCYKKCYDHPISTLKSGDAFCYEDIVCETYIAASVVKCIYSVRESGLKNANINDFEFVKKLGSGAFCTVYLAKYKLDKGEKLYAIKCIENQEDSKSLENEINLITQLTSPFIVHFYTQIKSDKSYIVMEALLGGDLFQLLELKSRFNENMVRFYAASIVEAFRVMHAKNIVYRDLKPENLMLTRDGYIKIIDFGISKKLDGKTFTCSGTLDYLAPEMIRKTGHDISVDYWALGVLIFEMATGECPFLAENEAKTCKKILSGKIDFPPLTSSLCDIIVSFLQLDPSMRLGSSSVKRHEWFNDFDWDALCGRRMKAPYIPKIDAGKKNARANNSLEQLNDSISSLGESIRSLFGGNKVNPALNDYSAAA